MKKILFLLVAVVVTLSVSAQAYEQPKYQSFKQVSGSHETEVEPNKRCVAITSNKRDSKGKISVEEQERKMISALNRLGIDTKKQLTVNDMSSEMFKKSQAVTTKSYNLRLTSASEVAAVFSALQDDGITSMDISKATRSDMSELRKQARVAAIKNAQTKAVELAQAVGQQAGKAFYIQDMSSDFVEPIILRTRAVNSSMSFDSATPQESAPLEFRKVKINYNVNAKFELL